MYLVREVLSTPASEDVDEPLSPLSASAFFAPSPSTHSSPSKQPQRLLFHSWSSDPFDPPAQPVYGRSFALKCLCKRDLSDELVEVQRGEAVLHRALPRHDFIVRLYGVRWLNFGTRGN